MSKSRKTSWIHIQTLYDRADPLIKKVSESKNRELHTETPPAPSVPPEAFEAFHTLLSETESEITHWQRKLMADEFFIGRIIKLKGIVVEKAWEVDPGRFYLLRYWLAGKALFDSLHVFYHILRRQVGAFPPDLTLEMKERQALYERILEILDLHFQFFYSAIGSIIESGFDEEIGSSSNIMQDFALSKLIDCYDFSIAEIERTVIGGVNSWENTRSELQLLLHEIYQQTVFLAQTNGLIKGLSEKLTPIAKQYQRKTSITQPPPIRQRSQPQERVEEQTPEAPPEELPHVAPDVPPPDPLSAPSDFGEDTDFKRPPRVKFGYRGKKNIVPK